MHYLVIEYAASLRSSSAPELKNIIKSIKSARQEENLKRSQTEKYWVPSQSTVYRVWQQRFVTVPYITGTSGIEACSWILRRLLSNLGHCDFSGVQSGYWQLQLSISLSNWPVYHLGQSVLVEYSIEVEYLRPVEYLWCQSCLQQSGHCWCSSLPRWTNIFPIWTVEMTWRFPLWINANYGGNKLQ